MGDEDIVDRHWFAKLETDAVRMRCRIRRRKKEIIQFTAQLELYIDEQWVAIIRYDNAHGFCHRDDLHPDGSQTKSPVHYGNANETFTRAVEELRNNWSVHCQRYLREVRQ